MMNGQPVGDPDEKVGVIPCSNRVESGVFFYPGNGSNLFRASMFIILNKRKVTIIIFKLNTLMIVIDIFFLINQWINLLSDAVSISKWT